MDGAERVTAAVLASRTFVAGAAGWLRWLSWSLWVATASCAPSEEELQEEFAEEVARSNTCEEASDCVIVWPGCPLDCWVAVNAEQRTRVEAKARELIDEYESGGRACDYLCIDAPEPACAEGRCVAAR
jgi:hypothetical protein